MTLIHEQIRKIAEILGVKSPNKIPRTETQIIEVDLWSISPEKETRKRGRPSRKTLNVLDNERNEEKAPRTIQNGQDDKTTDSSTKTSLKAKITAIPERKIEKQKTKTVPEKKFSVGEVVYQMARLYDTSTEVHDTFPCKEVIVETYHKWTDHLPDSYTVSPLRGAGRSIRVIRKNLAGKDEYPNGIPSNSKERLANSSFGRLKPHDSYILSRETEVQRDY